MFFYSESFAFLTLVTAPLAAGVSSYLGYWRLTTWQTAAAVAGWLLWQRFVASGFHLLPKTRNARGKVVIVTGANTGIGYYTALELAKAGATVIVTCRSKDKCDETVRSIKAQLPAAIKGDAIVRGIEMELSSYDSVRRAAQAFVAMKLPLHVLINNAGAAYPLKRGQFQRAADGTDLTAYCNFVAPVLLTELLRPLLEETQGRVVNVASRGNEDIKSRAQLTDLITNHPDFSFPPSGMNVFKLYCWSKLGNEHHASYLARKHKGNITAVSLHPGGVLTDVWRSLPLLTSRSLAGSAVRALLSLFFKTSPEGAETTVHCALEPVENGAYYADESIMTKTAVASSVDAEEEHMQFAFRLLAKAGQSLTL